MYVVNLLIFNLFTIFSMLRVHLVKCLDLTGRIDWKGINIKFERADVVIKQEYLT